MMGSSNKKVDKALDLKMKKRFLRQTQMIAAAEKLFTANGFDRTRMEAITEELGYSKRTFYLYFRDKNDIFYAVLLPSFRTLYDRMYDAVASKSTGFEKIIAQTHSYFAYYSENPNFFELNRTYEAHNSYYLRKPDNKSSEFEIECQNLNNKMTELLISSIKQGIKDKSIRIKLEPKKAFLLLWGMALGVMEVTIMRTKQLDTIFQTSAEEIFNKYIFFLKNFLGNEK